MMVTKRRLTINVSIEIIPLNSPAYTASNNLINKSTNWHTALTTIKVRKSGVTIYRYETFHNLIKTKIINRLWPKIKATYSIIYNI